MNLESEDFQFHDEGMKEPLTMGTIIPCHWSSSIGWFDDLSL